MDWIFKLNEVSRADVEEVGAKAAHLGEMIRAGFNTPDGLVISAHAFADHFSAPYRTPPAKRPRLKAQFKAALDASLDETFNSTSFAVRSSALGEDGDARSFAGQHDTYYFVSPEEIEKALVDCWMSIWNTHALAYRQTMDLGPPQAMAVIIQPMVRATSSGVCFSEEPTGRFPGHALIESTWGLGAALVDGRVSPDQFFVRDGAITHQRIVRKRYRVAENTLSDRRLDAVPSHQQAVSSLTVEHAITIGNLANQAAELFGGPQDVEWAVQDNSVHVLQSRPVTSPIGAEDSHPDGKWVVFKPLLENFHEPLTPMTVDLFLRVLPPIGQVINGRFYLKLDAARKFLPVKASEAEIVDMLLLKKSPDHFEIDWKKVPALMAAGLATYFSTGVLWHRTSRIDSADLEAFLPLLDEIRSDPGIDAAGTLQRLLYGTGWIQPITRYMFQINVSAGRYFLYISALEWLLKRVAPVFDLARIGDLIRGDADMYSSRMVRDLDQLRMLACEYEAVRQAIEEKDPERLMTEITTAPSDHPFISALQTFLSRYGHRCIKEMELASPRWREDPAAVIGLLQASLRVHNTPTDTRAVELSALDELHQCIKPRHMKKVVDRLLDRIRYYVTLRENSRFYHTMIFDLVRQKLKNLERELIYDGKLKCADDIFYLVWQEVCGLQNDELTWEDVGHLISERRRQWVRSAKQHPPHTLNISMPELKEQAGRMSGQCASPGCVEGNVRIVFDPTLVDDLGPDDILVAPYTDPAWTPLFPVVAAVVVGIGSFLSHAGTVAREFQIPCLVDVAACTDQLQEGMRIRVNATDGYLEVLDT
jgi:pyruvate,water dikinase